MPHPVKLICKWQHTVKPQQASLFIALNASVKFISASVGDHCDHNSFFEMQSYCVLCLNEFEVLSSFHIEEEYVAIQAAIFRLCTSENFLMLH